MFSDNNIIYLYAFCFLIAANLILFRFPNNMYPVVITMHTHCSQSQLNKDRIKLQKNIFFTFKYWSFIRIYDDTNTVCSYTS